jgi:hypothetical protein
MVLDPNRQEFLEFAARSYIQATAAMAMFQREVYQACRRALTKHRPELTTSMGVPLDGETKVTLGPSKLMGQPPRSAWH